MSALKSTRSTFVIFYLGKIVKSLYVILVLLFCNAFQAQNIAELEYFFGNDTGVGNGTLVIATVNYGDLTQSIAISLVGLDSGFQ